MTMMRAYPSSHEASTWGASVRAEGAAGPPCVLDLRRVSFWEPRAEAMIYPKRLPSLVAALFLQFAPLLRTVEPAMLGVLQPVFVLLRWASAAATVAGGAHALSGATGLVTAAAVRGTNAMSLSYRAQITSDAHGTAKSYTATGLPPGVVVSSVTAGIISGSPSASGTYAARVTGWENSNRTGHSYTATLTFTIVDGAPVISAQPASIAQTEGGVATFSVTATGVGLTYRWLRDGLELAGATNATLTLNPVKPSDAGQYQVRVQNSGGAILSTAARLTVNSALVPPVFITSPVGKTVHPGEFPTLTAVATVATPGITPTYSWTRDGSPVAGTSGTLVLNAITASQAGSYRAIATANGLSITSAPAVIAVVGDLRLSPPALAGSGFSLQASAIPGRRYLLERAADPAGLAWNIVGDEVATGSFVNFVDSRVPAGEGFYRVVAMP